MERAQPTLRGRWAVRVAGALAAGAVGLASLGASADARATWGDPAFQTEEISAYTLRSEEMKVGPAVIRYGLPGGFQIGSRFGLNLLGALNGELKWNVYREGIFAIGLEGGVVYFDPALVGIDEDFDVVAFPVRLSLSFSLTPDVLLHIHTAGLVASPETQAPDAVLRVQRYIGPVGKVASALDVEWRVTEHLAIVFDVAVPLVMHDAELLYADENPDANGEQVRVAASLMGSFDTFNFRVGVGFGPSFLGEQGVFPIADFYWRLF